MIYYLSSILDLRQGLSEPEFYGVLVYKFKKNVGSILPAQWIRIISHFKKISYNIKVLQQTACLVVNPNQVDNFAFLFNCTLVGRTSDYMTVQSYLYMRGLGPDVVSVVHPTRV